MSNYLSRPYQPTAPVQRGDINFDLQILNTLQTRYDANKAATDQVLSQFENLRGERDIDNQYIAAKVNQVKGLLNGNIRYEHASSSAHIRKSAMNIVQDPIVRDAILSKTIKQNFDAEAAKRKEKNDGSYNDVNYQYSLEQGGYQDYMAGKTNKLSNLSYVPYTDFKKELKEIGDNIEKYDTEIEKTWAENGYIYTRKGKVITEDKIKGLAESFLSDGAKKQMTISGWATVYQGANKEEKELNTRNAFNQYSVNKLADEQEKLTLLKGQAKKTGSEQDKKNVEIAQENYSNIEKRLKEIAEEGTAEQMYGTIYKEGTLSNFAKTMAYNTVDITDIKGDTTHMAREKMQYDMQRDVIKDAQWQANYDLSLKKEGMKKDADGNLVGDGSAFQTKADFGAEVPEGEDVEAKATEEINGLNTAIDVKTEALFSGLDEDTKKAIELEVKNSKGLKTKADVLLEYHEGGTISIEDANELEGLVTDRYVKQEAYNKHAKAIDKEKEALLESEFLYKDLYNNPNIKIMWKGTDGKERLYPAKEVLVNSGLVNEKGEKLKSNANVTAAIKKSMLADKYLSTGQGIDSTQYLRNLAKTLGEDFSNVYVKNGTGVIQGGSYTMGTTGTTYDNMILNPNSKTAKFLEQHKKGGGYNRDGVFKADDSFDDISSVNKYFTETDPSRVRVEIGNRLAKDTTVTFGRVTTVMPDTAEYAQIAQQAGFNIKDKLPIEIKQVPNQPNMVSVSLGVGSATKEDSKDIANVPQIGIADLHPNVLKQVNFYNSKNKLNVDNFPSMFQKASFTNKSGTQVTALAETFYGGNDRQSYQRAKLTTVDGAKEFYFSNYNELLGTESKPTELGKAIKNIVESQDTYIEVQKTKTGRNTYILPVIKKGENIIFTPDAVAENLITNDNADSVHKTIKFTPQDYINRYVTTILNSENQNEIDKIINFYGK